MVGHKEGCRRPVAVPRLAGTRAPGAGCRVQGEVLAAGRGGAEDSQRGWAPLRPPLPPRSRCTLGSERGAGRGRVSVSARPPSVASCWRHFLAPERIEGPSTLWGGKVVLIPGFPLIPETQFQSGARRSGSPYSGPVGGRQPRTPRVLPARSRSVDSRVSSTRFPRNAPVPPGRQLRVLRFLAHSWRETEGALGPGLEAGEQGTVQRCGRRARPAPQARGRAGGRAQGGDGPRAAHGAGDAGPRLSHPAALPPASDLLLTSPIGRTEPEPGVEGARRSRPGGEPPAHRAAGSRVRGCGAGPGGT